MGGCCCSVLSMMMRTGEERGKSNIMLVGERRRQSLLERRPFKKQTPSKTLLAGVWSTSSAKERFQSEFVGHRWITITGTIINIALSGFKVVPRRPFCHHWILFYFESKASANCNSTSHVDRLLPLQNSSSTINPSICGSSPSIFLNRDTGESLESSHKMRKLNLLIVFYNRDFNRSSSFIVESPSPEPSSTSLSPASKLFLDGLFAITGFYFTLNLRDFNRSSSFIVHRWITITGTIISESLESSHKMRKLNLLIVFYNRDFNRSSSFIVESPSPEPSSTSLSPASKLFLDGLFAITGFYFTLNLRDFNRSSSFIVESPSPEPSSTSLSPASKLFLDGLFAITGFYFTLNLRDFNRSSSFIVHRWITITGTIISESLESSHKMRKLNLLIVFYNRDFNRSSSFIVESPSPEPSSTSLSPASKLFLDGLFAITGFYFTLNLRDFNRSSSVIVGSPSPEPSSTSLSPASKLFLDGLFAITGFYFTLNLRKYSSSHMELDLDAFLQFHDASTSDDEDDHNHRSTVDELILIDSDDASSPSSPISYIDVSSNNAIDASSSDSLLLTTSQLVTDRDKPRMQSKFRSINSGETFSQLPRLFRSNAKPGAALAAATAASRLIPTPHAAAIKLTREKSGMESLDPKANIGDESGTALEISHLDVKLVEEDRKLETASAELTQPCGELITEHEIKNVCSEDFLCEEFATDVVANTSKMDGFDLDFRDETLSSAAKPEVDSLSVLSKDGTRSVLDNEHIEGNYGESVPIIDEGVFPFPHGQDMDAKEDSISVLSEKNDAESIELCEEDVEYGLQAEVGDKPINMSGIVIHQANENSDVRTPLKPLKFAEELEKKHAFTGMHWEEGAAAQPMKLEGVHMGSAVAYFSTSADNTITRTTSSPSFRRDHGTPQALAVHFNYIAVGMSRGLILVVPSKYSPHYADNMDAKMLMLGLQGDRSYAPVTSMSFNHQGDLLFAGYADGHYTVWDVQRISVAKVVTEHKAPVVHILYLGMDSQVTRQFNIVSGDSKGVVKLIRFSPFSWLSRFSTSKTSTLLDESTSTVVCASPLVPEETFGDSFASNTIGTSGVESMVGGDLTSAEEGVVIFVTHQSALVAKVISNTPQVYAQLPKPDGVREGSMPYTAWKYIAPSQENVQSATMPLLAIAWDQQVQVAQLVKSELKVYAKWTLENSATGIAWLDDQMLVVLTSAEQLCLYANDGTLIHDTSFAVDGVAGDVIGHHTHFSSKAHHNCIAVRGASLYLLGPTHLVVSRLLPWKERIEVLRRGGDWMGAFNMAMMLFDGQSHGVFDLPRALGDVQKVIMPHLVELLLAYVDEVFSYISVALGNQLEHLNDSNSVTSEQYTSVGGVAVEFCVHIKRTDILFDEILSRFESVQQKETFLELLEPYILKDMLGSLPPEIMHALVEHYSAKGWLQRVEQCVLHMDISSLDFNQVVRLCQEHNLYRALIYLFNKGLDDFRTPLEELLLLFTNSGSENAPSLGYRMLVYLKYCFSGLAFPPGHGALSPARLPSLRRELIHFLLEDSKAPRSQGLTSLSAIKAYKNLYHLLELDTEATLDVLRCAFINEIQKSHESAVEKDSTSQSQDLTQKIVDVLVLVLETSKSISIHPDTIWPSKDDIGYVLEFISHFVSRGEAKVTKELLGQIFEYLTLEAADVERKCVEFSKIREKEVLALLVVVPQTDWDDKHLLDLCEKAHFYQACGFIYNSRHQYIAAFDSFMKDVDEPIYAFSYIHNLLQGNKLDSLEAAVISRISNLVQLSR
ncbi:hypothetical protein R6Q59_034743 [Mikania micrantha]